MKTKLIITLLLISFTLSIAQEKDLKKWVEQQALGENGKELVQVEKQAQPLTLINPHYPQLAQLAGIEGKVFLKILVNENGDPEKIEVLKSDNESLNEASIEAVKKTKFSPAIANNKPIKTWVVVPLVFKLKADTKKEEPEINESITVEKYPELIESSKPEYPELAKKAGIEGKVFVKVLVDKEGNPKKAVVIKSENEIFNQSAVNAAMKSKFTPAINKGEKIAVWIVLPFKYALGDKDKK